MRGAVRAAGRARLPTAAVPGIDRSIIRFVEVLDPDDHGITRAALETMRDEHLAPARAAHCRGGVARVGNHGAAPPS
ncbi:hypothetical protein GCM10010286_39990 [Streptomyces toxytricini]|nr:hypothetical protein GCM10010286_39990 [Streptomyces toxytricini]